jgi:hypothetical protein
MTISRSRLIHYGLIFAFTVVFIFKVEAMQNDEKNVNENPEFQDVIDNAQECKEENTTKLTDVEINMDDCPICLTELNLQKVYKTNCNHRFHEDCMIKWQKLKPNCPMCRENINGGEEEEVEYIQIVEDVMYVILMILMKNNNKKLKKT